jgi:hypothetical protein
MNQYRSMGRIMFVGVLVVAAGPSTARCQYWDPLGIQNHYEYKPFGKKGPKITITTLSPTKILNGGSLGTASRKSARRRVPSRTARFDDLNLLVNLPRGPWVKLDPKQTGSRACLLMRRRNPAIFISLAVEPVGAEGADSTDSMLAASQTKIKSLPDGTIASGERQLATHGIQGISYEASAIIEKGARTHYSMWVASHNGYNFQLAVYGDQKYKRSIDGAMRSFLSGVRQIDSHRVARNGDTPARPVHLRAESK